MRQKTSFNLIKCDNRISSKVPTKNARGVKLALTLIYANVRGINAIIKRAYLTRTYVDGAITDLIALTEPILKNECKSARLLGTALNLEKGWILGGRYKRYCKE